MDLIIRGGTLVLENKTLRADLHIRNGHIHRWGKSLRVPRAETLDARGQYVFPGAIDPHVHHELNLGPGRQSSDTFVSGSTAALHGGVTTMFDFAHQEKPRETLVQAYARHLRKARGAVNRVRFHAGIMRMSDDLEQQIADVAACGVRSFKLYLNSPQMNTEFLYRALRAISEVKGRALLHCEDGTLTEYLKRTYHAAGKRAAKYLPESRPAVLEIMALTQALILARECRTPLYIVHLSTGAGARAVAAAQATGLDVAAETCPQYLLLDESIYRRRDGHRYTCTPPLRTAADREVLWALLRDEIISCLGTDHCPFTKQQKDRGRASFVNYVYGLAGVETGPALMLTEMRKRNFGWPLMGRLLATNAARLFGLYPRVGVIAPGARADLFLYDPHGTHRLSCREWHMQSDVSQFEGWKLHGRISTVLTTGPDR